MSRRRSAAPMEAPEHRWPPIVAVLGAVVLWVLLPPYFFPPLQWGAAIVCALLIVPLVILNPRHMTRQTAWSRALSLALAFVVLLFTQVLLVQLVLELLTAPPATGVIILVAALQLWATNAIAFGLVFWELDAGGPVTRASTTRQAAAMDFEFPQYTLPGGGSWRPRFFDYLYVSITAGLAFSSADAVPLTRRAKAFMAVEALSAFIISVLVIARAVSAVT
ncbi:DUF1345 domain-containing protein [Microbacterium sp. NPDC078428]|uniref:DUF1345 domain-containing protein n=1 Tax=Microbacterium sp. NPDC078428 TaxID=3364190 RepID=UPI0037CB9383